MKIEKSDMCLLIVCALFNKTPKKLKINTEPHRHYKRLMKWKKSDLIEPLKNAISIIEKRHADNFNIKDWTE